MYCRECYVDGVGTRKLEKLIETNWGFDSRYKVVGYTKDRDGKVMRVFVNKYDDPEGDLVSERSCLQPVLGQRVSILLSPFLRVKTFTMMLVEMVTKNEKLIMACICCRISHGN